MTIDQGILPSQFILTYGVGSIIETPSGPVVIPAFRKWGPKLISKINDPKFSIPEISASVLLKGAKIFKIPTNSSFAGVTDSDILFPAVRFPMWALCLEHKILYRLDSDDGTRCHDCLKKPGKMNRDNKHRYEAIRFVRACENGHMDDIQWEYEVHKNKECKNSTFEWEGGQNSLAKVTINCPECRSKVSLHDIYNSHTPCSGYMPEEEKSDGECGKRMQVILRSQSNLRIPKLITVITIPPSDSNAYLLLSEMDITTMLALRKPEDWNKDDLISELEKIHTNLPKAVGRQQIERTKEFSNNEIMQAIIKIMENESTINSMHDVMDSELQALKLGARDGAPPITSKGNGQFEIDKRFVKEIPMGSGTLRISPIQRLRTVIVQRGYTRTGDDQDGAALVQTTLSHHNSTWYPGMVLRGEGLFIDFPDDRNPVVHNKSNLLMKKFLSDPSKYREFHPVFVWWHTLSHAIINMLSVDSGYSSASIRERIYFQCDPDGTNAKGGILLYTSQPSGDGSMGGLITLANDFKTILGRVRSRLQNCSNDPLCTLQTISQSRTNGAACYACLLLSETSCESGNSFLDRNLIKDVI